MVARYSNYSSSNTFGSLVCVAALLVACVDDSPPPIDDDERSEQDAGVPAIDISDAPSRGGPGMSAIDEGFEPSTDESPDLHTVLAIADPDTAFEAVATTNSFRRLTHLEFDHSVADLLQMDVGHVSRDFPEEAPTLDGYFAQGTLTMTGRLQSALQTAVEGLASDFVADGGGFDTVRSCESGSSCRDDFIETFGRRAYRRPLTDAEVERYRDLFQQGDELIGSGDAFRDGARLVVEGMLQSPNFLYRVERGSGEEDEFGQLLTDYEIATRLSFMLWGTTPDDELLDAAASGDLADGAGLESHAERMLDDARILDRVIDYHSRWLQLESISAGSKDEALFPEFSQALVAAMVEETERFVEETTLNEDGALIALLTAPYGFVNTDLADLYGLAESFDEAVTRVDFDEESPRLGLLTQASFLSGHSSTSTRTSPILRGVFVLRRLLCQDIPDPPPNAQAQEPKPAEQPIITTRQFFEWKTGQSDCVGCHTIINPVGYGFEAFDAIGRHRTEEDGEPVATDGELRLASGPIEFENAKDLVTAIAELEEAHACYARNWFRYLWGRADTEADLRTLATIRHGLAADDYSVRDLLMDTVRSAAFTRRALPPEPEPAGDDNGVGRSFD